jgi:hypothetical protein
VDEAKGKYLEPCEGEFGTWKRKGLERNGFCFPTAECFQQGKNDFLLFVSTTKYVF